jgi:phytoene dehydrogenase-like protein
VPVFEVDAVVVGGGHHGLVAAAVLADAGWALYLGNAAAHPGGGVHEVCGFLARRRRSPDGRAGFLRRKISSAALALVHGSP